MLPVEVKNLSKTYRSNFGFPVEALKEVSFGVDPGEIVGYLGPNGAGKTTTFKILTGLVKHTSGEASIEGININNYKCRASLGYLPEGPYFYEYLTGEESLFFYASLFGKKHAEIKNRVSFLLDRFEISYAKDRKLQTYSKGMRQRLGFAQCIINDPQLVILDEPMSGLDPMGRKQFREAILELKENGKTVLLSSHIMNDIEMICSRVVLLKSGKIIENATIHEILNKSELTTEIVFKPCDESYKNIFPANEKIRKVADLYSCQLIDLSLKNEIIGKLIAMGHDIVQVNQNHKSLEEYFLDLSKDKL
ncbi:MAG: ABC transporter ATP-binding protein [Planctomycetota bacterium]|nr:MAG: ABC transporter ATP-binding protein [Planctomycetota bacterium]